MSDITTITTIGNNKHSDSMSAKRKQSTLEKLASDNTSSTSLPSTVTKRARANSLEIKSTWFQRLYASPSMYSLSETEKEEEADATDEKQLGDNKHTDHRLAAENESRQHEGNDNDGGDDNDDGMTNRSRSNTYYTQGGLWSWLGYSPSSPTPEKGAAAAAEQQQSAAPVPEPASQAAAQKSPSLSASATAKQKKKKQPQLNKITRAKAYEERSSSSTPSTPTPIPAPSEMTAKEDLANRNHRPSTSTSWRSFFWTSPPDQRDSVIVEKNISNDTQQLEQQQQQEQASATSLPTNSSSSTKRNMVLPPLRHDGPASPQVSGQDNHPGLLTKALWAINTMFSQSSPITTSRVNQRFAKFVQAMETHPDDIANKRFVIIGVHGWFPMKLVRNVIGEPTGTSPKFCEQMVQGLKVYFKETHDLSIPEDAITIIPLEGEGKVGERVDKLYENLKGNAAWMSALASADVIFWATHSQGTPVSTILLHRLIEERFIRVREQPVCFLAMAGISHGPFPSLKGNLLVKYFEADAARELFEFMDSKSAITQRYRESMGYLLHNDVKTVLIGSMQDQVVPLYSAIMAGVSHPNILRAIYIDGHVYSEDDFLINLITFALKLRNAGLSDHGLLTHLSEVLAGDLYSWEGGGHSTVYEEVGVFSLAVQHLFESDDSRLNPKTSSSTTTTDSVLLSSFEAKMRLNPFYLPWAMRGICDDALVLGDQVFSRELDNLRGLFERWKPASAKLREVKFRLEPLKARL